MRKVLVIDAERDYADALRFACVSQRALTIERERGDEIAGTPEIALCVAVLRGLEDRHFERVRSLGKLFRHAPIIILADGVGEELAFRLSTLGVADVIALPGDPQVVATRALSHLARIGESGATEDEIALIGETQAMVELRAGLRDAARVPSKVLLQGETGTGKGVAARLVHRLSARAARPFIHVDCAALSPTLIESELFGHEKGAFTGAASLRRGRFELATDGTVFLDEIGDLDLPLQSKLLRVLEDQAFERVGGSQSLPMTARVIAATSRDLLRQVQERRFRQDLYFRLNVAHFRVPALRERASDLPLLVHHGLQRLARQLGVALPRASSGFLEALGDHDWPGNVRELFNLLERLLIRTRADVLELEDLEAVWQREVFVAQATRVLPALIDAPDEDTERALIREALVDCGGNVSRSSRRLGIPRGTLRYKIRKYRLNELIPRD